MSLNNDAEDHPLAKAYRHFRFPEPPPRIQWEGEAELERLDAPAAVPPPFDWRKLVPLSPASHQGRCNACTSFAIAATIEAHWLIAHRDQPISVSAGFIHTCLGHRGNADAHAVCQSGVDLFAALALVRTAGFAQRRIGDYPFPATSCPTTGVSPGLRRFAAVRSAADAMREIATRGPIVADMYIWADFFDYTTVRAPAYVPDVTREGPYPHSVCVVGFDARGWIIRNSLGPTWGDGVGCAVVPYGLCALLGGAPPPGGVARQAYAIELAV